MKMITIYLFPFALLFMYAQLRVTGHAISSVMGRAGAFFAIFWVNCFAYTHPLISSVVFALSCIFGGIAAVKLPETKNSRLDGMLEHYSEPESDDNIGLIRGKYQTRRASHPVLDSDEDYFR